MTDRHCAIVTALRNAGFYGLWQHEPFPSETWDCLIPRPPIWGNVLGPHQVRAIRRAYAEGNTSTRKLAAQYGVSANTVWHIVAGKRHRDVTEEATAA